MLQTVPAKGRPRSWLQIASCDWRYLLLMNVAGVAGTRKVNRSVSLFSRAPWRVGETDTHGSNF